MAKFASMWYGPMTRLERLSINSFVKNGHEHHIYLYDMENAKGLPKEAFIHDANDILAESEVFQDIHYNEYFQFGDIFRLRLAKKIDAVWADLDTICLSPNWEYEKMFLSYMPYKEDEFDNKTIINNSLFYIKPNSLFLDELISIINNFDYKKSADAYGPSMHLFTEVFLNNKNNYNLVKKYIYPSNVTYPIHYHDIYKIYLKDHAQHCHFLTRQAFAVHLWRNTLKQTPSLYGRDTQLLDEIPEEESWLYKVYQKYLPFKTKEDWELL
jgi:hypothetical protein